MLCLPLLYTAYIFWPIFSCRISIPPYFSFLCRLHLFPSPYLFLCACRRMGDAILHTLGRNFSFNVMLSDPSCDFTGGGTYFDHPLNYTRQPASIGGCLVHCGKRRHAGNAITRGTRYLLVGFVDEQRRARGAHQCSTDESSAEEASLLGTATAQPIRSASKTTAAYADNASIELHFQDHS